MHHKISPEIKWVQYYLYIFPRLSMIFFFKIGSQENAFTFKRIKQIAWTAPKMLLQKNIVQQLLDKLRLQNFKKVKSYFLTSNFEQKSSQNSLCVICTQSEFIFLQLKICVCCNVIFRVGPTHLPMVLFDNNLKICVLPSLIGNKR